MIVPERGFLEPINVLNVEWRVFYRLTKQNFSTIKFALSNFIVVAFPKKTSDFGRFSFLSPRSPPPSKAKFLFLLSSRSLLQTGGLPDLDLSFLFCPFSSFLGLSGFFRDFPDLSGDSSGIFPICPFLTKGRHTQKTTHPNKNSLHRQFAQTISGQFVQTVHPFPFKISRKQTKEFAQTVCANSLCLGGCFFGWVAFPSFSWVPTGSATQSGPFPKKVGNTGLETPGLASLPSSSPNTNTTGN